MENAKNNLSAIEEPLEPDLPICDAHHHLWERPPNIYLLNDFLTDLGSGHNVVATIAIECGYRYRHNGPDELKPLGETEFLESVAVGADSNPRIKTRLAAAIVGFADLNLGDDVAAVLEGHLSSSPGRFRGIRQSTTWDGSGALRSEAAPGMLLDGRFRRGFSWLQRFNLSFDAWLYHPQLPELADLARVFPRVTIVLNHIGAPLGIGPYAGKREEVYRVWQRHMASRTSQYFYQARRGGLTSLGL